MEDPAKKSQEILDKMPEEARKKFTIDNDGNLTTKNRAYRRRKPPSDNKYTKNTHKLKKQREKAREKFKHNRRSTKA